MGLEADGTEIVAWSEADIRVKSGRKAPEQRNGGLGAAFFGALDLVGGHVGAAQPVVEDGPSGGYSAVRDYWAGRPAVAWTRCPVVLRETRGNSRIYRPMTCQALRGNHH